MAFTPTELAQEIKDLTGAIRGFEHYKRAVRTDMENEEFYARSRLKLLENIQYFTKQLNELDDRHVNGEAIIERTNKIIDKMTKRRAQLQHSAHIAKLLELRKAFDEACKLDPVLAEQVLAKYKAAQVEQPPVIVADVEVEFELPVVEDETPGEDATEFFAEDLDAATADLGLDDPKIETEDDS
jgi:Lhr-like helicase